ncbi:ATP-binding protein [Thiohalophilus sp.]|uniref:ATP-binding protein n=1 Tax=Thiohalophilus sp. TaxID=3028392 RepID=UPI002ACD495E|nr:ATP-binding protein [Thiohalophilus sp.]MDZ7661647.1 ATP-binding protein [Thiohalophilus sp.]
MSKKIDASPTKDFFVRMITRDITLEDCILDLLDNCIDGAGKDLERKGISHSEDSLYEGYQAKIVVKENSFFIDDNCGGISLDEAIDYAFHFGRRPDAPKDTEFAIGLYGIGMKRAIFKLGNLINISSCTDNECFQVNIDVNHWLEHPKDWDFDLDEVENKESLGTSIKVTELKEAVSREFSDQVFKNTLKRIIARDYSFFIQKGFLVLMDNEPIEPYRFMLRESDEFEPMRHTYIDEEGVEVEIIAGMSGLPPEDISPSQQDDKVEYYGWFVACNDRIVLAGDKTKATVWGDEFPVWHTQYNGFMGIVNFKSSDPSLLPWTTTKREIDLQDAIYKRALHHMKKVTRNYIDYTNERKDSTDEARALEDKAKPKPILELKNRELFRVPSFSGKSKVDMANIQYRVERDRARQVGEQLGSKGMTLTQIGIKTFEYFYSNEVEDE